MTSGRELVRCHNCQRDVPAGAFCGACGAHLAEPEEPSEHRHRTFAAHPSEAVLSLRVISTLLPHLPHRRSLPFRIGLAVTVVLLSFLALVELTGPAIALAATAVPALYLVYLFEVEVYEDEPFVVLGVVLLSGLVPGILWALLVSPLITRLQLDGALGGGLAAPLLIAGVALPLAALALMLIGSLVLYATRRAFDEALDGFTFAAAGALSFTFAVTLIDLLPQLQSGLVNHRPVFANFADILTQGVLTPILNASSAGLIGGALWLRRAQVRADVAQGLSTSLLLAIAVGAVAQVVVALSNLLTLDPAIVLAIHVAVVGVLLIWVRLAIHHMLMGEAVGVEIGPDFACSHCHRLVPRMAFCPNCGIATRATPKTGAGRELRAVR